MPANDSPLWGLIERILICVVFIVGAAYWTANGWSWEKDFPVLIGIIGVAPGMLGIKTGIGWLQAKMKPKDDGKPK